VWVLFNVDSLLWYSPSKNIFMQRQEQNSSVIFFGPGFFIFALPGLFFSLKIKNNFNHFSYGITDGNTGTIFLVST